MKKVFLLLGIISCVFCFSCAENKDCVCTAIQETKATAGAAATYQVYDWGSSCSNVTQNNIPELSGSSNQYNINCTEI